MIRRFLEITSVLQEKPVWLAMGDSIISDCYPGPGFGVASLLGRALSLQFAGLERRGVCRTGYQLADLQAQLPNLTPTGQCRVGLLSVGGNDLMALDSWPQPGDPWFTNFSNGYADVLARLKRNYPNARWLICNVYDPTDGSGQVPGRLERGFPARPELVEGVAQLNQAIARVAGDHLVDLHSACWGHGWSRAKPLWFQRDIEPNREGAAQICSLLLNQLHSIQR